MNEMINELREENAKLREEVKNLKQGMIIIEENCDSAQKRAKKAEAEVASYHEKLREAIQAERKRWAKKDAEALRMRDIEQQIVGITDAVSYFRAVTKWRDTSHYRVKQVLDAIDLHTKQLRRELEK